MKALPIYVYRNNRLGDCTNGGISSKYDQLLLICPDGFIDIDEENPPENLVKIVERKLRDGVYKHIEPVASAGWSGWMAGGNYASRSDIRFSELSHYPLSIHDRTESRELYEAMSR